MTANLQKQVDTLGTRTDSLESILGQFIASVNSSMLRTEADTRAFKEEIRADTKAFKEEIRADTEAFRTSVNDTMTRMEAGTEAFRTSVNDTMTRMEAGTMTRMEAGTEAFRTSVNDTMTRMEAGTEAFRTSVDRTMTRMEADTEAFKTSVDRSVSRTEASVARMETDSKKFRKEINKKWGDLSNKMGTLVEDMVAPNIPGIAREFFGDDELDRFFVRMMIKNTADPSRRREFDVIAMTERNFYVSETKSNPRSEYIGKFIEALGEIRDYFPEIGDRRIIPIFASLHIPEDTMRYLTRNRIYAMGMDEDTMTLLNFEELSQQGKTKTQRED